MLVLLAVGLYVGRGPLIWIAACGFLCLAIGTFRARRQYLASLRSLRHLDDGALGGPPDGSWPGVTLIAPGRDEAQGIKAAVRSFLEQDYPDLCVVVVNDHSTDGTRAILDGLLAGYRERLRGEASPETGRPEFRVVHDPPLQEGWLGKANAVWRAVHDAPSDHEWLAIVDADTRLSPSALRAAIWHAEEANADFLTCIPRVENGSLSEELYLPQIWSAIVMGANEEDQNRPDTVPTVVGAFVLVRRRAYLESGGHSVHSGVQPEDVLLGRTVRSWGGKLALAWTSELIRIRHYNGYAHLRDAVVCKLRVQYADTLLSLFAYVVMALLLDCVALPVAIAAAGLQLAAGAFSLELSALCAAAIVAYVFRVRSITCVRPLASMRPAIPWLHPLGGLLRAWLCILAIGGAVRGRELRWRGRDVSNAHSKPVATDE